MNNQSQQNRMDRLTDVEQIHYWAQNDDKTYLAHVKYGDGTYGVYHNLKLKDWETIKQAEQDAELVEISIPTAKIVVDRDPEKPETCSGRYASKNIPFEEIDDTAAEKMDNLRYYIREQRLTKGLCPDCGQDSLATRPAYSIDEGALGCTECDWDAENDDHGTGPDAVKRGMIELGNVMRDIPLKEEDRNTGESDDSCLSNIGPAQDCSICFDGCGGPSAHGNHIDPDAPIPPPMAFGEPRDARLALYDNEPENYAVCGFCLHFWIRASGTRCFPKLTIDEFHVIKATNRGVSQCPVCRTQMNNRAYPPGTLVRIIAVADTGDPRNVGRTATIAEIILPEDCPNNADTLYRCSFNDGITHDTPYWMDIEAKLTNGDSAHFHSELEIIEVV
jgi:ribosomal protein L37AE/L43A